MKKAVPALSRRDLLAGAGAAIVGAATLGPRAHAAQKPHFDVQAFIEACRNAGKESDRQAAIQELMKRAMSQPDAVLAGVGEPHKGGIQTLYRSADLTILNIVWAPLMQLLPHEHRMWSVIGIYSGREDNIFWERRAGRVAAVRAASISEGDAFALPLDVVHSVANPIGKLTGAIHVYGGDFFATPRSEWDPETLAERDWSIQHAIELFAQSNDRFFAWQDRSTCR